MQDERNTPQEDEEVEGHRRMASPSEGAEQSARDDEDEVEAHSRVAGPSESRVAKPEE